LPDALACSAGSNPDILCVCLLDFPDTLNYFSVNSINCGT
jgi:hypothetical protein